jgi:hypothetical protein
MVDPPEKAPRVAAVSGERIVDANGRSVEAVGMASEA